MLNSLRPSERLLAAVTSNDAEALREAIQDGADVNFRRTKNTPLLLALDRGNKECAQILIDNGADVNLDNGYGWLPIHEIARHGWLDWVERFVSNPMCLTDRRDRDEATPLLIALVNGHEKVASVLVGNGSNVNAQNEQGVSPLMLAIERESLFLVEQMMAKRGDASLQDSSGRSGLDRAENWAAGRALLGSAAPEASAPTAETSQNEEAEVQEEVAEKSSTGVSGIQKRRRPS